jgi:hypothetical protein
VPKVHPAPTDRRKAFRAELPARRRIAFDELVRLIAEPRQDLPWYHAVGRRVRALRPGPGEPMVGWSARLAAALGPNTSLFRKAALFVRLYPEESAPQRLTALGADWSRMVLSFSVPNRKARHALLREGRREGWTISRFRFEVQQRFPSARRGVGGRPRRTPDRYGPEVCVRELGRLSRRWLDFFAHAWEEVAEAEWGRFAAACRGRDRELLAGNLDEAEAALRALAAAARAARDEVVALRRRVRKARGPGRG